MIREAIRKLIEGESLDCGEAAEAMEEIMAGEATPAQIGSFATALRMKGETVEEIVGLATVMRRHASEVRCDLEAVDTCGTGGDGAQTFNISTTAAFVVAGAGVPVAKHGNRAVTSSCGSADLLEALGVRIEMTAGEVAGCLEEVGMAFMYAPAFHPAMRHAGAVRREIGVRTVFNWLGPLTNPAGVTAQVVGVSDKEAAPKLSLALHRLGARRSIVVHSADGVDEISISGPSFLYHGSRGEEPVRTQFSPEEAGLPRASLDEIRGGSVARNVAILQAVLAGEHGPRRDVVLLNAAAALLVAGKARSFPEGVGLAADSIDSGAAAAKLRHLVHHSRRTAAAARTA